MVLEDNDQLWRQNRHCNVLLNPELRIWLDYPNIFLCVFKGNAMYLRPLLPPPFVLLCLWSNFFYTLGDCVAEWTTALKVMMSYRLRSGLICQCLCIFFKVQSNIILVRVRRSSDSFSTPAYWADVLTKMTFRVCVFFFPHEQLFTINLEPISVYELLKLLPSKYISSECSAVHCPIIWD